LLVLPEGVVQKQIEDARVGLTEHYNKEMERIINENSSKEIYWILGKVKFPEELGGKVGRSFLEASDTKPPLVKEAFLYEVDNKRGVKTLLWVMHPDGSLRLPTLGKTVRTQPERVQGRNI